MIINNQMRQWIDAENLPSLVPDDHHPIWKKIAADGREYYGVDNFWGVDRYGVTDGCDLTELEWNGNELYIDDSADIQDLLYSGLKILYGWKLQLETSYSDVPFDIFLSIDTGDEEDEIGPSANLRFWAVRDGVHFITADAIEGSINPIIMIPVNYH